MTVGTGAGLPERLSALVARARAGGTDRTILVSASEEIADELDPLWAIDAAAEGADEDGHALLEAGSMYWAHPAQGFALAGLGAAATIAPAGDARFARADAEWRALLADAVVDDAGGGAMAGPILMGGFSFEPEGPRSDLWRDFPSTLLLVPALHVATRGGRTWLTLTTVVAPDGTTSVDVDDLLRLRAVVLDAAPLPEADAGDGHVVAFTDVLPAGEWRGLVDDAVATIGRGVLDKVVLARAVRAELPDGVDHIRLLDRLRTGHRDGYVFGCWRDERLFAGASPERLVRLERGVVDASSLAGSTRRGDSPAEDAALAAELRASEKDLAEHAMVRTALRDALGALCDDVTSNDEPALLSLPNVHHLHTAVRARLRDGHSLLALVGALHPTPAVGGTPRAEALRFIVEHERLDRGWYAAPIGWIGRDAGELAVALRSALVTADDATLFAGCGIVAGSDAARELAESHVKLRAMESALAAALGGVAAGAPIPDVVGRGREG